LQQKLSARRFLSIAQVLQKTFSCDGFCQLHQFCDKDVFVQLFLSIAPVMVGVGSKIRTVSTCRK
jgi:hypothetical protein